MLIDTTFNVYTDANGRDPDKTSPTLKKYHQILWSKALPNGTFFNLSEKQNTVYLCHKSEIGEFILGSDSIVHSYKNQKKKKWIVEQIPMDVDEIFNAGSTIGGYIIFPNKKIDWKQTINQSRGVNSFIDDRFDLTLECIRLFYLGENSPLYDTLLRYKSFFDLFESFMWYVEFFLLEDLLHDKKTIKFYLPFDNFSTRPMFKNIQEYKMYKKWVMSFINARNKRINKFQYTNNI